MAEIILIVVIAALLVFLGWRDLFWGRQISEMTNKLMSRDFREYAAFNNKPAAKKEPEEPKKRPTDPTLGQTY